MTPVMSSPTINISLIPGCSFGTRKNHGLRRCYNLRKPTKIISYAQDLILPLSTSLRSFPNIRSYRLRHRPSFGIVSASGVDVDVNVDVDEVKQPDSDDLDEESGQTLETPSSVDTSNNEESSTKPKQRSSTVRKSDMPPVKNEDLVPGATFTGKVRSIQPYGAFIDIGAFTNGLVHVSRLSDEFVKDVADVVSIGQEVQVTLVEANIETGRISLTMRDSEPTTGDKESRPPRYSQKSNQTRDEERNTTKFAIGETLDGVVKELTNAGALITLPEEEEGYLPLSEVPDEGIPVEGSTTLEVGQEVRVQVLRVTTGRLTLTMRTEQDAEALESYVNGIHHEECVSSFYTAENPFLVAFYKNEDIAAFLDEKEKTEDIAEVHEESSSVPSLIEDKVDQQSQKTIEVKSDGDFDETETSSPPTDEKVEAEIESISGEAQLQTSGGMIEISSLSLNDDKKAEPVPDEKSSITSEQQVQIPVEERITTPLIQDEVPEPATEETSNITSSDEQVDTPVIQESTIKVPIEDGKVETVTESISREAQLQMSGEENETSSRTPDEDDKVEPSPDEKSRLTSEEQLQIPVEESTTFPLIQDDISEPAPEETSSITGSNEQVDAPVIQESTIEVEDGKVEVVSENVSSEAQLQTSGEENEISSQTPVEDDKAEPFPNETSTITSEEQLQIPVEETSTLSLVQDDIPEPAPEETSSITSSNEQVDAPVIQESIIEETQTTEIVENQLTPEVQVEAEMLPATPVEDESVGATAEQNGSITSTNEQSNGASPSETTAKATISPALVKQLREETGAGMMDCKKALAATEGDLIKAQEYLRKKGLASADKKASRATAEGRIGSYIHDSRIGVLIEVNCETDFVSRGDIFKELVNDLAMQVAACPQVEYLVPDDVPKETIEKEKAIEMQREDLLSKPEQIRSKIVEGRIKKRLEELALLEQPYIKDDKVVVRDFVKSTIATIGENIKVKRFARFNLGEGLEKKTQDFAAEVAAQTSAKPISAPAKEQQPAVTEANETAEPPKAEISAALVKQLREETGAGMMDCKKALSETGGDLEKAQEYLRKKGLSTADKKSGRLAAEGRIGSYIHDSRIGVLIEVNCETDFVGRSEKFKELVDDLAMQVVACPRVEYVSIEDIPASIVNKEKEIEMQREDILSKPENIREKIVEGRVSKRLGEIALLEQPYLKDDSILVKDLVKQTIAAIGENIKVRRFIRFTLGESSESKSEETES